MGKYEDPLQEAAHNFGVSKGIEMAKKVIDKDSSVVAARVFIDGYFAGDEDVHNVCPKPLSGEWANGGTLNLIEEIATLANADDLLKSQNIEIAMDSASDVLDIFEEGYKQGFFAEALRRCNALVEANESE